MSIENLYINAIELLKQLISTPSLSRDESATADIVASFLSANGVEEICRDKNNVWAYNRHFDPNKPTILLNSHHDTVKPNSAYSRNPFSPEIEDGKLFGLGSNDAGASVVSLIATFLWFYNCDDMNYNLCIAITAEEEVSGANGMEYVAPKFINVDFAIVGEPTNMNMAIAERGLLVLDCKAIGVSGHAARNEGDNAIYKAMRDIEWFKSYEFEKKSEMFGAQKMNVTIINSGTQHNVVPSECNFTVDIRITDRYTHKEVLDIVQQHIESQATARSFRISPSSIDIEHPIVQCGLALGRTTFGSPTTSDQALMKFTSVKMGVGDSSRSHTADEFVYLSEIKEGISIYIELLDKITKNKI
ncbi:MAG: M20 family metallo-hydrolase [Rikenellaceae bacterium]